MRSLARHTLLILAASIGCHCCHAADVVFRIATFNINWGNADLPSIEKAILSAHADVVCLQETNVQSERYLKARPGRMFPHMRYYGHQGQYRAERFGFLSKVPLVSTGFLPPNGGLFGTAFATVDVDGTHVRIANVHLHPFGIRAGTGLTGILQRITATEETHGREIAAIASRLDPKTPTIVAGDFNSPSGFRAPQRLVELKFTDSFAAVIDQPDLKPTWRWIAGRVPVQLRIDYVFHSQHFRTRDCRIIPAKGSDHALVASELILADPR